MYVHVREPCAGCGDEIDTKREKYIQVPDGRFFHLNCYEKTQKTKVVIKPHSTKDPMEKLLGKYYKQ